MNQRLKQQLEAVGQEHLPQYYARLDEVGRRRLRQQFEELDLERLNQLIHAKEQQHDWAEMARRSEPPPAFRLNDQSASPTRDAAREAGQQALRAGKVAVILVAGGQGSRLGFHHPKGMFPIGPVSGHSIFQILIERVRASARRYHAAIPLFVMTSPATDAETRAFLDKHDRFGLAVEDLTVFCQGTMPAIDATNGRLLMAATDSLALAPDGHGGMLAAMVRGGCLRRARERGIELFSYGQIDNPLVQICDPELIGYHVLARSEMTSQVIQKTDPLDKVGNVVVVDGKMRIIEYSDLPDDVARQRNADGSLRVWAGSIAVHVFDRAFLERMAEQANALPFHRARKTVSFVDLRGERHVPEQPNAIKFERFIFDLLPWAEHAIVVEGDRSEAFAPVKNGETATDDTPSAVRSAMNQLHARWLRSAGASISDGVPVEISPAWALDAGQVSDRIALPLRIDQPTYLQ